MNSDYISTHTGEEIDQGINDIISHQANVSNPHNVTKGQIGLGNVDNTADLDKPISTATQAALDIREDTTNKVTTITESSTDIEYPGTKAVYDFVMQSIIEAMEDKY